MDHKLNCDFAGLADYPLVMDHYGQFVTKLDLNIHRIGYSA